MFLVTTDVVSCPTSGELRHGTITVVGIAINTSINQGSQKVFQDGAAKASFLEGAYPHTCFTWKHDLSKDKGGFIVYQCIRAHKLIDILSRNPTRLHKSCPTVWHI